MNPLNITLLVLAIVAGQFFIWISVSVLLSRLSGWGKLAQNFPATGQESGKTFRFQSAYVGWVRYKGALTFLLNSDGFGLSIMFPFRIGHSPLFIPWENFHNLKETRNFMFNAVTMEAGDPLIAKLTLPRWVLDEYPPSKRISQFG